MTTDPRARALGPLGWRLLAAFLVVAMSSVLVLTAAALIGTAQGLTGDAQARREVQAAQMAERVAAAYTAAGGWQGIDVTRIGATADALDARLVVRDLDGRFVVGWVGNSSGVGAGMGMGMMGRAENSGRWTTVDVQAQGVRIGTLSLGFATAIEGSAQQVAWSWIAAAALAALVVSVLVAWFVTRRISTPLLRISSAARRFAAGDRGSRTDPVDATAAWELGELARAFDATADAVVASEAARRRVSSDVAHELRTPLAALQAGLEELRDGLVPADSERLTALHAQAVRLSRLVADLSALSAAETASLGMDMAEHDLGDLARGTVAVARPAMEAAGLQVGLKAPHGITVRGDGDRLHQALLNLLMNAARHCRAGDRVEVAVIGDAAAAHVVVEDTGPGIPDGEIEHVFERLWRGARAADVEGSGIGLAVVRELMVAHGGSARAEHREGGGTRFILTLPLR